MKRGTGLVSGRREVAMAAQMACLLEVSADKPGNVTRHADFSDTRLEDFLISAVAISAALEEADRRPVGETIWLCVRETRLLVPCNTNLGIILLFTPLARAAGAGEGELRQNLRQVLSALTVEDARQVYRAIRLASPGGLGRADNGDIGGEPEITLLEAMELAQDRDAVAREYSTGFELTFTLGKPALEKNLAEGLDFNDAIIQSYLLLLSAVPDTLIARKVGVDAAAEVSRRARDVLQAGGVVTKEGCRRLISFVRFLRSRGNDLNPGTTADLTAASIFVLLLEKGLTVWADHHPLRNGSKRS